VLDVEGLLRERSQGEEECEGGEEVFHDFFDWSDVGRLIRLGAGRKNRLFWKKTAARFEGAPLLAGPGQRSGGLQSRPQVLCGGQAGAACLMCRWGAGLGFCAMWAIVFW
jgi:hypothetical protein